MQQTVHFVQMFFMGKGQGLPVAKVRKPGVFKMQKAHFCLAAYVGGVSSK
ncbi:hypothetical protein [Thiolapillus sp.]